MSIEPAESIESIFEEPYMEMATFANPDPKVTTSGIGGEGGESGGETKPGEGDGDGEM